MMRVVIYDTRIREIVSSPSGSTYRYLRRKGNRVQELARIYAPKRTGELARSIEAPNISVRYGGLGLEADVFARAEHALWVHEGTGPEIRPDTWPYMVLKPPWGVHPISRQKVVKGIMGTKVNPFLANALRSVMAESRFVGGRPGF